MSSSRPKASEGARYELLQNLRKLAPKLVAIFIVGILLGYAVICGISYISFQDKCNKIAQSFSDDFFDGLGVRTSVDMATVFFDNSGNELLRASTDGTTRSFDWVFKKCTIKKHMSEPEFWLVTDGNPFEFLMVSAVADNIEHSADSNMLHIYYIWNNSNITLALVAFIIAFCVCFAIGCLMVIIYYRTMSEVETMRRDYVSNVSHELKTPIASIKALTQTLSDGLAKDSETRSKYYGIILSEANRLERAVINLLELNRLQARIEQMEREAVDAQVLIDSICDKFSVRCDDMGIQFFPDARNIGPAVLNTNARRITELLEILLDNAVKFVSTENGEIHFEARRSMRKVTFCVRDNGIGISHDKLPHIFDRFYKANDRSGGSGLGLSIAQEICKQLGEDIWVKSHEGEGTSFFFTVSLHSNS